MAELRLYSTAAQFGVITLLVTACAGCWEKIEYKGPRTTVASSPPKPASEPAEPTSPPETTPSAERPVAVVPDAPAAEIPASAPFASDTPSASTVGDRYALPPATDAPAASGDHLPRIAPTADPPVTAGVPSTDNPPGILPSTDTSASTSPTVPTSTIAEQPPADAPPPATDAAPSAETPQSQPALKSRRAAWLMGSWLSLSALAHDRGVATQNVPAWFEFSQKAAKFLGTTVGDLPEPASPTENAPASKQVVDYLLVNGLRIGQELAKSHGPEEPKLFEVALKSNMLLVLYTPGSSECDSIALAISQAAPKAKLPTELWQPVVDAIQKKAPAADVRAAVQKLHADADKYLTQLAEQKGQ